MYDNSLFRLKFETNRQKVEQILLIVFGYFEL